MKKQQHQQPPQQQKTKKPKWWVHAAGVGVAVCLAAAVYSNAVDGMEFVFDDHAAVIRNADTNPASPAAQLWRNDYWGTDIRSPGSHRSYRPLTVLTFRLNRAWAQRADRNFTDAATGELHHAPQAIAPSFHAVNVAVHACVVALLYAVVARVCAPGDALAATIAAALFAAHPVHTESVAGIVGRADLLCAFCALLAYALYAVGARADATNWVCVLGAALLVVAATLCKEVGLMAFVPLAAHDALLVLDRLPSLSALFKARLRRGRRLAHFSARIALLVATGAGFLLFRKWLTQIFIVPDIRHVENPIAYTHGFDRILNLGMLHTKYMQLLIAPVTLSADWSYNCLPLVRSLWDVRNLFSALMYGALLAIIVLCVRNLERGRRYVVPLLWLAATFFPSSNILFNVGTTVGERLLYVPSVGFCIVVGIAASSLLRAPRPTWIRIATAVLLLSATAWYGKKTFQRNPDWKNDFSIYSTAAKACPGSAKAQMLIGQELQVQGFWKECIPYLQRALEIEPDFCETAYSLGVALYRTGSIVDGLRMIQRGVDCNFTTPNALRSLFPMYQELMTLYPNDDLVMGGYAQLLAKTGLNADAATVYYTLGKRHWDENARASKEEGLRYVLKAASLVPTHCELQFWAGSMSADLGRLEAAADLFEAASYEHNCSKTYLHALDRLIPLYQTLSARTPAKYAARQTTMLMRAHAAAQAMKQHTPGNA